MRGWVLLHYSPHSRVRTLNPDIIQKLSLRESWQRNCRSPPPPSLRETGGDLQFVDLPIFGEKLGGDLRFVDLPIF